jgi:hypothetical protein
MVRSLTKRNVNAMKTLSIVREDVGVTDHILIRFSAFVKYWRKRGSAIGHFFSYFTLD